MSEQAFNDALVRFVALSDVEWRAKYREPPKEVFHYTNAAAFKGILESQRLWATATTEVNDLTELGHAADRLRDALLRHRDTATLPEYRVLYPPQVTTFSYERDDMSKVFVASLSEAEDDLLQWSMYADHFAGVAIGFDAAELCKLDAADNTQQAIGFFEIAYAAAECDHFWDWFVSEWEREAAADVSQNLANAVNPLWHIASWFGNLAMAALTILPRMKSPYFAGEREWRLAHVHFPDYEECAVHSAPFKTHVELDLSQLFGRMPITSVWLGPAVANEASTTVAVQLLARNGYGSVPVRRSLIPLRGEPKILGV